MLSGLNQTSPGAPKQQCPLWATRCQQPVCRHCLIPPHPGAAAAAGIIGVDFGKLLITGIAVAVPASAVGYWWARYAGKNISPMPDTEEKNADMHTQLPSVMQSFLPVMVPILLIALGSFSSAEAHENGIWNFFKVTGDPVIALFIGVLTLLYSLTKINTLSKLLREGAEKAGGIL